MRFMATDGAVEKLNRYQLTEFEVSQEALSRLEAEEKEDIGCIVLNWKNEDLIILPVGKKTAIIFEYGKEIEGSYENLPIIRYRDNHWSIA